jgi:hypothetical protein
MLYKAKISFSGLISMAEGEVKEILDSSIAKDLLNAGYVEKVEEEIKAIEKAVKKRTAKK